MLDKTFHNLSSEHTYKKMPFVNNKIINLLYKFLSYMA